MKDRSFLKFQRIVKHSIELLFTLCLFLFFYALVMATAKASQGMASDEYLIFLMESIGNLKGASVAMSSYIISQIIIKFIDSIFRKKMIDSGEVFNVKISGRHKILIVSGVTFINTISGLMAISGLSLSAAAVHSATLSAFSVFANQIYKQCIKKD